MIKKEFEVGVRNGQIVHKSGSGDTPLVNIIRDGIIIGGFHDERLAAKVVTLMNKYGRAL